jgi:hypothetical protein
MGYFDSLSTRREAIRAGAALGGGYFFHSLWNPTQVKAQGRANPRGSARFCIVLMLDGGQSQVDTWDLKEGDWTPQDFDIRHVSGGIGKWPYALYPQLAERFDKFLLARSMGAWDAVHGRAQYYIQTGHPLNLALSKEIPGIGAIVASEYASRRRDTDTLPPYVAMNVVRNQAGLVNSGFLPAKHSPFHIDTTTKLSAYALAPEDKPDFDRRWKLLKEFDERLRTETSLAAKTYRDYNDHYEGAVRLMSDPRAADVFQLDPEEQKRYGNTRTGDACILARNLVEADAGTHFIFVDIYNWDQHSNIYGSNRPARATPNPYPTTHQQASLELDSALAPLLDDLSGTKRTDGTSLLDETLVVCMGEFGRTPGPLSISNGRDHFPGAFSALFAGGGVKGGRVLGKTDEMGARVVESGWHEKRPIYPEDVAATIYSAMGVDWGKTVQETPSGRTFYYIEPVTAQSNIVNFQEISEFFT